jgi:hypothetical protein
MPTQRATLNMRQRIGSSTTRATPIQKRAKRMAALVAKRMVAMAKDMKTRMGTKAKIV